MIWDGLYKTTKHSQTSSTMMQQSHTYPIASVVRHVSCIMYHVPCSAYRCHHYFHHRHCRCYHRLALIGSPASPSTAYSAQWTKHVYRPERRMPGACQLNVLILGAWTFLGVLTQATNSSFS